MKSFQIYVAKFKDWDGFVKPRPVVVLRSRKGKALCFKVTSQFRNKNRYIRHNYCILRNWSWEGFRKRSFVDMNSTVKIPKHNLKEHVGYLSRYDFKKVVDFGLSRY